MKLMIGDGSLQAYDQCRQVYGDCDLLSSETVIDRSKNYHTSIKDLRPTDLSQMIAQSDSVRLGPLDELSHQEKMLTDTILSHAQLVDVPDPYGSKIQVNDDQIIFLGCSHTYGYALPADQRFGRLISDHYGAQELNLGKPASSIIYASSMLARCDLRPHQSVFFQITEPQRLGKINEADQIKHVIYDDPKNVMALDDSVLLFLAYSAVSNTILLSRQLDLRLSCFMLSSDSILSQRLSYLLSRYKEYLPLHDYNFDLASDNAHFGPKTHRHLADMIIQHHDRLYGKSYNEEKE